MGATCVGKGKKTQTKKIDNKSNTVSSEMQSNEEVILHNSKEIRLPIITLLPYKHYDNFIHHERFKQSEFRLDKEYRYQELLQFKKDHLVSSYTISQFSDKRVDQKQQWSHWTQCSTLQRQYYPSNGIMLHNGNTYIKIVDAADKQSKQNINKIDQTEIQVNLAQQVYPKQLMIMSIEGKLDQSIKINQKLYEIVQHQDIQVIYTEILQTHPHFEYFYTPFLNGVVFTQPNQANKEFAQDHFLSELFALKKHLTQSTFLLLYTNKRERSLKVQSVGKLSTYFQVYNYIKQRHGDIWHSDLNHLCQIIEKQKCHAFLAIQFLRCIIDSAQRSYLTSQKHLQKKEDLSLKRSKLIQSFLFMNDSLMKKILFLANTYFTFQGYSPQESDEHIKQMLKSIACELTIISDGLFHEFGYEINEKDHYFKLQSYYFIKNKHIKKSIRHLYKNIEYPHHSIVNHIKGLIMKATSLQASEGYVEDIRICFLKNIQEGMYKQFMGARINSIVVQDFLIRLKLTEFYLSIIDGKVLQNEWKAIQDHINLIEYIAPQTMLLYFTLGGLISTTLKINIERTQAEEYYYLKALELAHKIYGDPRTNRASMPIEKEQAWQLLILQNYSALFKGPLQKKEFHYLNNIYQCLKQDLKAISSLTQFLQDENPHKRLRKMIEYLPIKCISGVFYRKSLVFDSQNEDLRSNYSQSLSSSSCKKTNRTSYKINQSQFSLKLSLYSGIIRWGHNIAGQPHILPPLKNKQVIAISSGNYHTVFLTQSGIFGWGENHSFQLGSHNKEKIYLKETICIKPMKINRNKDKYQISCGNQHTAVLINGVLSMWGQSQGGILAGDGYTFDYISCGGLHTLAIRDGVVFSWGRGQGGQLGHPLHSLNQKKKEQTTQYFIDVPSPIKSIPSLVVKVVCGDAHSLVLTIEGKVYVFGFCYQGQLGLGLTGQNQNFQIFEPLQQSFFKERIIDIFAGPTFSFFKSEKQQVYSCGINDCLQLGIDRVLKVFQKKKYLNRTVQLNRRKLGEQQFSKPRKIDMFNTQFGINLIHLQCGQNHCLALVKYMGQQTMLMGWGLNKNYQIDSQLNETTTPRTLDSFYCLQISQICCGSTYSLANVGKLLMTDEQLSQFLQDVRCLGLLW